MMLETNAGHLITYMDGTDTDAFFGIFCLPFYSSE